jgi:uncharacterized membrane protein YeaQ/YmgE (transglycosylase-associated protein family)
MGILGSIIIGLFVGIVAKLLMPGRDPGGFFVTVLLGMAGAVVANLLGHAMGFYRPDDTPGFFAAVIGAILILAVYRMITGSTAARGP